MAREREKEERPAAARRARGPREQGTGGPEERVGGSLAERVAQTTLSPNGLEPRWLRTRARWPVEDGEDVLTDLV